MLAKIWEKRKLSITVLALTVVLAPIVYIRHEIVSHSRSVNIFERWYAHLETDPDPAYSEIEECADPIDIYDVGYIDDYGNWIIEPAYTMVFPIRHNRILVCDGEKFGYESKDRIVIVKPKYDWADSYWNGYAMVGNTHFLSKLYIKLKLYNFIPLSNKWAYRHWIIDENGNRVNSDVLR